MSLVVAFLFSGLDFHPVRDILPKKTDSCVCQLFGKTDWSARILLGILTTLRAGTQAVNGARL